MALALTPADDNFVTMWRTLSQSLRITRGLYIASGAPLGETSRSDIGSADRGRDEIDDEIQRHTNSVFTDNVKGLNENLTFIFTLDLSRRLTTQRGSSSSSGNGTINYNVTGPHINATVTAYIGSYAMDCPLDPLTYSAKQDLDKINYSQQNSIGRKLSQFSQSLTASMWWKLVLTS